MNQKIRNIKYRLRALWWWLTKDSYYLFSFSQGKEGMLESYNIDIPQFLETIKIKHGYATNEEIAEDIRRLSSHLDEEGENMAIEIINKLNYE